MKFPPTLRAAPILVAFMAGAAGALDEAVKVNGHALTGWQSQQLAYVKQDVVHRLPGTPDMQLKTAAKGLWWALREGIVSDWALKLVKDGNIHRYNSCTKGKADVQIGLMEECGQNMAWQVGMAGAQAYNDGSGRAWRKQYSSIRKLIAALPGSPTEADILAESARLAGVDTATADEVQKLPVSPLRNAWLLRAPVIGFAMSVKYAADPECFPLDPSLAKEKICFNTKGPGATFSPDRETSERVIADLEKLLQ